MLCPISWFYTFLRLHCPVSVDQAHAEELAPTSLINCSLNAACQQINSLFTKKNKGQPATSQENENLHPRSVSIYRDDAKHVNSECGHTETRRRHSHAVKSKLLGFQSACNLRCSDCCPTLAKKMFLLIKLDVTLSEIIDTSVTCLS